MSDYPDWLPPLVLLGDHDGNWNCYIDAVFAVFYGDFIYTTRFFRGEPIRVGTQLIDGKERTFWHVTSQGKVEADRIPCLRRCERIRWLRAIIEHECDPRVLSWPQKRGRKQRHILWLKDWGFAVVLEKRPRCWWLWTAHPTEREHTRRNHERDYEAWKKADAAR